MTNGFALFCTLLTFSTSGSAIDQGTHVLLRPERSISTRTAKVGDLVDMRTDSPVTTGGVSIPIGSHAQGVVTRSRRAGRIRGRAELEIRLDSITLPDGRVLPVVAGTVSIEPLQSRPAGPRAYPPTPPKAEILLGMLTGYVAGALAGRASHSEETAAKVGVAVGIATVVLIKVLPRGSDLELNQGTVIDVIIDSNVRLN
jgi:hypothetical protein